MHTSKNNATQAKQIDCHHVFLNDFNKLSDWALIW